MGKRKVSILEPAATAVAEIALFIESEGLPQTAKKFVDDAFLFFAKLSDERIEHKPCSYKRWKVRFCCRKAVNLKRTGLSFSSPGLT